MDPIQAALSGIALILLYFFWRRWRQAKREAFIRGYSFPPGLYAKVRKHRPELDAKDMSLVGRALRKFFLAYLQSGRRYVSMPSQVADDLWHEFILYTRHYEQFCKQAFGGFLHHTPAVVLSEDKQNNSGLRRIWFYCCKEENIDPRHPLRLPLLFAIDAKLGLADGFVYTPDCSRLKDDKSDSGTIYCGGDFSSSSFDGGTDGFGYGDGGDGGSGDGGDGGGDGGGCGGGCGGGD